MNIKQQLDYVEIIKTMHLKVDRLWGEGSNQELAMRKILNKEYDKLIFMLEEEIKSSLTTEQLLAKIFNDSEDYIGW